MCFTDFNEVWSHPWFGNRVGHVVVLVSCHASFLAICHSTNRMGDRNRISPGIEQRFLLHLSIEDNVFLEVLWDTIKQTLRLEPFLRKQATLVAIRTIAQNCDYP